MQLHIIVEFIPISLTGRASTTNSISTATVLLMISTIQDSGSRLTSFEYRRHAKSQWSPSSWLISSLLKHKPGIKPHFFSQKIAQKEPKKKMPSMAANAIMRLAKLAEVVLHHLIAHCAFHWTHGTVLITRRRCSFFAQSLMYVSMKSE